MMCYKQKYTRQESIKNCLSIIIFIWKVDFDSIMDIKCETEIKEEISDNVQDMLCHLEQVSRSEETQRKENIYQQQ
ncbi:hypothetical protein Anas_09213, partial [Armadillidium nasatum]